MFGGGWWGRGRGSGLMVTIEFLLLSAVLSGRQEFCTEMAVKDGTIIWRKINVNIMIRSIYLYLTCHVISLNKSITATPSRLQLPSHHKLVIGDNPSLLAAQQDHKAAADFPSHPPRSPPTREPYHYPPSHRRGQKRSSVPVSSGC